MKLCHIFDRICFIFYLYFDLSYQMALTLDVACYNLKAIGVRGKGEGGKGKGEKGKRGEGGKGNNGRHI